MASEPPAGCGLLFVLTGLSGAGKTTLCLRLCREVPDLEFSVSYTTRGLRPGERDGVDYRFVGRATFEEMRGAGELYEWAEVYGSSYGTARSAVDRVREKGVDVLLQIDIKGAWQVKANADDAIYIFVLPPDMDELEKRLRGRRSESEEAMRRRLNAAASEVKAIEGFDYVVINDELEEALAHLKAIVAAERLRTSRVGHKILARYREQVRS